MSFHILQRCSIWELLSGWRMYYLGTKRGVATVEGGRVLEHTTGLRGTHEAMQDNDSAAEKSIVDELNFGEKTAKRVAWEAWEFTVAGPHQIEVTNASWGYLKDEHSYVVGVEERDGQPVPADCGCKADRFRDDYDCKHKAALAAVGNFVVLQAALDCSTPNG